MNPIQITRAAVLYVALALCGASSHAQTVPDELVAPAPEKAMIRVRNLGAEMMAHWLDPKHNPLPVPLQNSRANGGNWADMVNSMTRQPGNGNGPRGLKLPDGIESILPVAPQNVLVVKGTAQGIEALRALVKELDVAMGQVEIEAQFWEIAPAEFAQLPLKFRNASRSTASFDDATFGELAFAPLLDDTSSIAQQLKGWHNSERARLVTAPRVTAIDGLAALMSSTEIRTFDINAMEEAKPEPEQPEAAEENEEETDAAPQVQMAQEEKLDDNWQLGVSRIQSQVGFGALPVLHGDLIALGYQITWDNMTTPGSTIMRDGQTLPIRLAGANDKGWQRVVLIKTRILPRADNEINVVVPGT